MGSWFQQSVVDPGRLRLFCFFVSFIVAFAFIRFSVRMIRAQVKWWPGNVTPGGVHVHHAVFGLVFMCVGGIGGLAVQDNDSGWAAVAAALLGIGTALLLDEFALVLFLKDVYWSEEGRLSVDVVFVAIALCGLALLGWVPAGFAPGPGARVAAYLGIILGLIVNLVFVVICLLKGKVWCGVLSVYIGLIGLVGAIRLARPGSLWARRRYPPGSRKMARARAREQRYAQPVHRFRIWFQDLIAGRPGLPRLRKWQLPRYGRPLAGS
jgi:hypothetical protein